MADRGVSTAANYVLSLAVVALLISGLFVATNGFVADQQATAAREELTVVGNRVAADVSALDRLARLSDGGTAAATLDLPQQVAGQPYHLTVEDRGGGDYALVLATTDLDVSVTVRFRSLTPVAEGTVDGGDVVVTYTGGHLEVTDA